MKVVQGERNDPHRDKPNLAAPGRLCFLALLTAEAARGSLVQWSSRWGKPDDVFRWVRQAGRQMQTMPKQKALSVGVRMPKQKALSVDACGCPRAGRYQPLRRGVVRSRQVPADACTHTSPQRAEGALFVSPAALKSDGWYRKNRVLFFSCSHKSFLC